MYQDDLLGGLEQDVDREEAVIGNNRHSKIHILSRIIKIAQLYINNFFFVVNF